MHTADWLTTQADADHINTLSTPSTTLGAWAHTQHGWMSSTSQHKPCVVKCHVYRVHTNGACTVPDMITHHKSSSCQHLWHLFSAYVINDCQCTCEEKGRNGGRKHTRLACGSVTSGAYWYSVCIRFQHRLQSRRAPLSLSTGLYLGGETHHPQRWWSMRMSHDVV